MLVLTRQLNQVIRIGADIEVSVVRLDHHSVRLGITAPQHVGIYRAELGLAPGEVPAPPPSGPPPPARPAG